MPSVSAELMLQRAYIACIIKNHFLYVFFCSFHFGGYKRKWLGGTRLRREPVRLDGSISWGKWRGMGRSTGGFWLKKPVVESFRNTESLTHEWADARAQGHYEVAWNFLSTRACSQFVTFRILGMSKYQWADCLPDWDFHMVPSLLAWLNAVVSERHLFLSVHQTFPGANSGLWPKNPCSPSKGKCLLSPIPPFTSIPVLLYFLSLT